MSQISFPKTLIIGLGLIGGSFAKALRSANLSHKIFAYDSDLESIDLAKNDGVIKSGAADFDLLEDEISNFDLIVIATPLAAYEEIFAEIGDHISPQTIVIDLGSLKNFIGEILPDNLQKNFVACHPIAGSEQSGFENSQADLFAGKKFIICKNAKTDLEAVKKVENMAKVMGCNVDFLDAKKHDEIYALVSHLPQFLSFLTKEFSPQKIEGEFLKKAFRLDDSDPEMWADIFELNEENLEKFYLVFFEELERNIKLATVSHGGPRNECGVTTVVNSPSECHPLLAAGSIDPSFLENNFASIFFRAILVESYLKIPEIKTFQTYAGSGFRDFTSITEILNYDPEKLSQLIKKNQSKILKIFNSLS